MNRLVTSCILGALASLALGSVACSPVAVGDPCTPEQEFATTSGAANPEDLTIDVNSVMCETRVCLSLYFAGRVTCPFGNNAAPSQCTSGGKPVDGCLCQQVGDHRGLYHIFQNGTDTGSLCCPIPGEATPATATDPKCGDATFLSANLAYCTGVIQNPVSAQCSKRGVSDSVYCSCRCDIPDPNSIAGITDQEKNELDKSKVQLCSCPSGYACVPLCDQTHGNCSIVPKGKWGSYCVKDNANGSGVARDTDPSGKASSLCGTGITP